MSCADLSFVPWFLSVPRLLGQELWARSEQEFPRFHHWWAKLQEVPAVAEHSHVDGIGKPDLDFARADVQQYIW